MRALCAIQFATVGPNRPSRVLAQITARRNGVVDVFTRQSSYLKCTRGQVASFRHASMTSAKRRTAATASCSASPAPG
ncbi:Uncharacterised protein [Mycobacteroides abscessus subsp. abscessus]|nr:Uncharacterised protein [Mycobacteroides abscessus subsp. abscessus]